MSKFKKIFLVGIVLLIQFFAFVPIVLAEEEEPTPKKTGWTTSPETCYGMEERALTVHYFVDGVEVNPGDPNAGSWYSVSNTKKYPCTNYEFPESYFNYNTGFGSSQKRFTNVDGTRGVIYWYDNPELEGDPVEDIYYTNYPEDRQVYLYAKTGPIIEIYANGFKKKVVVGRMYSPYVLEPDYSVSTGVTHYGSSDVNYWHYSTEADYFSYSTRYREHDSNPTYTYYRDKTATTGRSSIIPAHAYYNHVDNTELIQFINYDSCWGNDDYLYCEIADPETGEAMTVQEVRERLNDEYATNYIGIHQYKRIPKYYKYFGFIDTEGREYPQEFEMLQEYEGRAFTTVVDGKMSCATNQIYPYDSYDEAALLYDTTIDYDGAIFSGDFNTNYLTKLRDYYSNKYFDDDKTNYYYSTCVPYDLYYKYTYKISNPNIRQYMVVIEGQEGEKVNKNSVYKLPDSGKPKSAEITNIRLKYQDGETEDEVLTYTTTYTPNGFKIDGVHYNFGDEIVVTRDLYITYDYAVETTGPDLPTPTRENHSFKGWFDATIGGHLITDPKNLEAKILYAQWNDPDKVTIVRPDGIPIELDKGSAYTMPSTWDKDEIINAKVSFVHNDRSGKVDISYVTTTYQRDGIVDTLTGNKYAEKETIIVNDNMVLQANFKETRTPATFPTNMTRNGYDFVGWFDAIQDGEEYTEYNGDKDLTLFAIWEGDIEQIHIYYPDGMVDTIDLGESYTLPKVLTVNEKYNVTFKYQDGSTPDEVQQVVKSHVGNGWYIDGILYPGGSVIVPEHDIYLTEDRVDSYKFPKFPTVEDKEWDLFLGWYDESTGGTEYTYYEDFAEKTFYGHWQEIQSKTITLGQPDPKPTDTYSVVFDPQNGQDTTVAYVKVNYLSNGWLVDGVPRRVGEEVTITRNSVITPQYTENQLEAEFPENPTNGNKVFKGWFDTSAQSGGQQYIKYNERANINLYARWIDYGTDYSLLLPGAQFAAKLVKASGFTNGNRRHFFFRKATPNEYLARRDSLTSNNIISTDDSPTPTYAWTVGDGYTDSLFLYYSEAATIYANRDCTQMFKFAPGTYHSLKSIDVSEIDFSRMEIAYEMFRGFTGELELGDFDSSSMTNADSMFYQSHINYPDLSAIETNNVTTMARMFQKAGITGTNTLDLSSWDVSKVQDFSYMFDNDDGSIHYIIMDGWNTSSATNMSYMFNHNSPPAGYKLLKVSHFNVSNVTTMKYMFAEIPKVTLLDLRGWDTSKVTDMYGMFSYNTKTNLLTTVLADNKWSVASVTSSGGQNMFYYTNQLVGGMGTTYNFSNRGKNYAHIDGGTSNPGYLTDGSQYYVVTLPDRQIAVPKGSEFTIPTNNYSKTKDRVAKVRFKYHNGDADTFGYVYKEFIPNEWSIDGVPHVAGDVITVNSDITIDAEYIETTTSVTLPSPTYGNAHFDGWYDQEEGGNRYSSYSEPQNITLHAQYTLPGNILKLPVNDIPKADDVYTVTFDSENGDPLYYSTVRVIYTPDGWLVDGQHYDDGDEILYTETTRIEYDYSKEIIGATYPSTNPTKTNSTFTGWFDSVVGGNKYDTFNEERNVVLYAHYDNGPEPYPMPENVLCKRATTLHSYVCEEDYVCDRNLGYEPGETIYYGYIGFQNYLNPGDAFTCDVDGDGVFDEETERFYYVSDYYDTQNKEFDDTYATLIYYKDFRYNSYEYYEGQYPDQFASRFTGYGPLDAIEGLPTTSEWQNISLKTDSRAIYAVRGSDFTISNDTVTVEYEEEYEECYDGEGCWTYTMPEQKNVPFTYPSNFSYSGYAARLLTVTEVAKAKSWSTIYRAYSDNGTNDLDKVDSYLYEGLDSTYYGDAYWLENPYSESSNYVVSPGSLNQVDNEFGESNDVRPVIDVPKSRIEINKADPIIHIVTLPDYTEEVEHGSNFLIPDNKYNLDPNTVTVTFDFQDGRPNYTTSVSNSYINNGWTIGEDHYNNKTIIIVLDDITLVPDYIVTTTGAIVFPNTPVREGYTFKGWYTDPEDGEEVTEFNGTTNTTLYAHWIAITPTPGEEYILPTVSGKTNTYTVTFKPLNGSSDIVRSTTATYEGNGWLVDGTHYNSGESIIYQEGMTLVPDYTLTSLTPVIFPDDPTKTDYTFVGWFDAENGGNKYTSYDKDETKVLYAHWGGNAECEAYTLPDNNQTRPDETVSTVTFVYHNDVTANTTSNVIKYYKANGWLVDGENKVNGQTIEKCSDTVIEPKFEVFTKKALYPNTPTKQGYEFVGWFTAENGGEQVLSYNGNSNITLHAHWTDSYAYLVDGDTFKTITNTLTDNNGDYNFIYATLEEYNAVSSNLTSDNIISTSDSPNPVYAWVSQSYQDQPYVPGTILYYSPADVIYTNEDSSYMFYRAYGSGNRKEWVNMDLTHLNTSKTVNMSYMFANNELGVLQGYEDLDTSNVTNMSYTFRDLHKMKSFDLSKWYTGKVTNMSGMFDTNWETTSYNLSGFDTSNVTNMAKMFYGSYKLTSLDLSSFDTSNVTDMSQMFYSISHVYKNKIDLDLSNFNTSKVTNMSEMFSYLWYITDLNISSFDTRNVTNMYRMFYSYGSRKISQEGFNATEIDISNFDTSKVTNMSQMFSDQSDPNYYVSKVNTVYVSDKWNTNLVTESTNMFTRFESIEGQEGTTYDVNHVDKEYARVDEASQGKPGYFTFKGYIGFNTVTLPDYVDYVQHGSSYIIPENKYTIDDVTLATVTFDYQTGVTNGASSVIKQNISNGFTINDVHVDSGSSYIVNNNITLVPSYTETTVGAVFPEGYNRPGYTFEGWFTERDGGEQVTSYDGTENVTFYAHWTFTGGNEYILPENNAPKASQTFTITFKPQNGEADSTITISKDYTPYGWKVNGIHRDAGYVVQNKETVTIEPDYLESTSGDEWPANPTKEGFEFIGWFTAKNGGNEFTLATINGNKTLYAQYNDVRPLHIIPEGTKCIRALELNTSYSDGSGPYGNYGTEGELNVGDAFDCDVNGDGIFDERFYFLSDYYDTETKTFDSNYATMVYYSSYPSRYYNNSYNKNYEGPVSVLDGLPTTSEWTNVGLYKTERAIVSLDGNNYVEDGMRYNLPTAFSYDGKAARLITAQEIMRGCDAEDINSTNIRSGGYYDGSKCEFLEEELYFYEPGPFAPEPEYTPFMLETPYDGTDDEYIVANDYGHSLGHDSGYHTYKVAIDVPQENIDLYVQPVYYTVTYPNGRVDKVLRGQVYTFATNNVPKESDVLATVTFNKLNGEDDYTSYVLKEYTPNGWKNNTYWTVSSGSSYAIAENYNLTYNYSNSTKAAVFPENPTKAGYQFMGWFDDPNGGNQVTSYSGTTNKTLYAHWTKVDDEGKVTLGKNTTPKATTKVANVRFNVYYTYYDDMMDYYEGNWDWWKSSEVKRGYTPNGWLVDGQHYDDYAKIAITPSSTIVPDYTSYIIPASFPTEDPTDYYFDGVFEGWYDDYTYKTYDDGDHEYDVGVGTGNKVTVLDFTSDTYLYPKFTDNYAELKLGYQIRTKIDSNAKHFKKATQEQYNDVSSTLTDSNKISLTTSPEDVYMWYDSSSETEYYYSEADVIFMNEDSSEMFAYKKLTSIELSGLNSHNVKNFAHIFDGNTSLTTIDLTSLDTTNATNMSGMFMACYGLTSLNLSKLNTSNVTDMNKMFSGTSALTSLDLSSFDTRKVTDFNNMFAGNNSLTSLNVSSFNTSNATNMSYMFSGVGAIDTLDLSSFDTSNVTNMTSMFNYSKVSNLKLSHFDTSNISSMSSMFDNMDNITELDLSTFNTSNITNMDQTFRSMDNITTIYVSNNWNAENVTASTDMFKDSTKLVGQAGTTYSADHIDKEYAIIDNAPTNPGYLTYKGAQQYDIYIDSTKIKSAGIGEVYVIPSVNSKDTDTISTVTFDYNDGTNTTVTRNVTKSYTPNGYKIGDDVYHTGDLLVVEGDVYLVSNYTETLAPVAFPDNPTRNAYTFVGWIDEQEFKDDNSQLIYTAYSDSNDITLYAAWRAGDNTYIVTYLDTGETEVHSPGDIITVPSSVNTSNYDTIEFYKNTQEDDSSEQYSYYIKQAVSKYTIGSTDYNPGQTITVNSDLSINRTYSSLVYEGNFPDGTNYGENFIGFFTERENGKLIKNYNEYKTNNITTGKLYAQYKGEDTCSVIFFNNEKAVETDISSYTYDLPDTYSEDKDTATVTYVVDGEIYQTANVHKVKTATKFTETYTNTDIALGGSYELSQCGIYYIEPVYSETVTPVTIIAGQAKDNYTFDAWYTDEDGKGVKYSVGSTYSDDIDLTLYANYIGASATEYLYKDTSSSNYISLTEYEYGDTADTSKVKISESNGTHYIHYIMNNGTNYNDYDQNITVSPKIDHWVDEDDKEYALIHTIDYTGNKNLYAVIDENSTLVDITLSNNVSNDIYPGHVFTGWYTDAEGGEKVTKVTQDQDVTVYAHWSTNGVPICELSIGVSEDCSHQDEPKKVPNVLEKNISKAVLIANGADENSDLLLHEVPVVKSYYIDYYEIDGVKYYPGSTYPYEEGPSINVVYSEEKVDSELFPTNEINNNYFKDSKNYTFKGWFTDRNNGDQVYRYTGSTNSNFYAHWKEADPNEQTYTVTIELLDGSKIVQNNVSNDTKIKLFKDEYTDSSHVTKLYDSNGTTLLGTATLSFTHTAEKYLVRDELKDVGDEITIVSDTYIKAYETGATKNLSGYVEPDNDNFLGYFTSVEGGVIIDFNNIKESDNVIENAYAHYYEAPPAGYVSVDFDDYIYNVPIGTDVELPTSRPKEGSSFNVTFNFNQGTKPSYTATINTIYTLSGYIVNNVSKAPGETVQANTNLYIRTEYTEAKDYDSTTKNTYHVEYPNIPTFTGLTSQPSTWVTDLTTMSEVTDVSSLNDNTNLYAVYSNTARVFLNGEVIATVNVGTRYYLPLNNYNKSSDTIATVIFNHNDADNTVTTSSKYRTYTPDGWYIGEDEYTSGAGVTVTQDITLVPKYKENIINARFPNDPSKEGYNFKGWYLDLDDDDSHVTSLDDLSSDMTLEGKFKKQVHIVNPDTGETQTVDEGEVITLESLPNKDEKFYNITFKYNYEGCPEDRVVRISTQEVFKGWLIDGVLVQAGTEITANADMTKKPSYEKVINNNNLPSDPTRDGWTFMGWYNSPSETFSSLVDISKIESDATVYARWTHFDPTTQVRLIWDGKETIHDIGTVISLAKDGTTTSDVIATVKFIMNKEGMNDKIVNITRETYVDHLVINGNNHAPEGEYTLNENTTITTEYSNRVNYPNLPVISDEGFEGFYTAATGGEQVTTLEGVSVNKVYYARWNTTTVPAIIDGEEVETDKYYTVPSTSNESSEIAIYLNLNYDGAPTPTRMTIKSWKKVLGQIINGVTYNPGDKVVLNPGAVITTNYSSDMVTTRTPAYTKPEDREVSGINYMFKYWYYDNDLDNVINVNSITGYQTEFNDKTLKALWDVKQDGMVTLHLIDGSIEKYEQYVPGTEINISDYVKANTTNSISVTLNDTNNNTNVTYTVSDEFGNNGAYVNNNRVSNDYTYTINTDSTIEIIYETLGDVSKVVDNDDYEFVLSKPPVKVNDLIYTGTYLSTSEDAAQIDILTLTPNSKDYDGKTLYIKYVSGDNNTTLTIDGEVTVVPKGHITLPAAKTKDSETIKVTYDYNNGSHEVATQDIVISYAFDYFLLNDERDQYDVDEYPAGSDFYIMAPAEFNSEFTATITYPDILTIDDEGFLGWYTSKTDGNKVTSLNNVTKDTTLYARWDESIYYTVPEASNDYSSINIYFDLNYDGAPNKTSATVKSSKKVLYQTINGVVHYPGDMIKLQGGEEFKTVYSDDILTTITPDVTTPEDRGNYYFVTWNTKDNDVLTPININNITGYMSDYDGITLYASWNEHQILDPENRVMLHVISHDINEFQEYEKDHSITMSDFSSETYNESVNFKLSDSESEYNVSVSTEFGIDKIYFNNNEVSYNTEKRLTSDSTLEFTYKEQDTTKSGDYPDYVNEVPPYTHDNKVYVGVFESTDRKAKSIDFLNIKGTDKSHADKTYYIRHADDIEGYTYLYLDDNPAQTIPLGSWTTPAATTKKSDKFFVTFDYNNGTGNKVDQAITKSYTFDHFHIDANGSTEEEDINAKTSYTVNDIVIMHSVYNTSYSYPSILTVESDTFDGWYTSNVGGSKVTTLDGITEPTTFYAQWTDNPQDYVITLDGEEYTVPYGTKTINPINLGYGANQIVKSATLTLVYRDNEVQTKTFQTKINHIGWVDENGNEFDETIELDSNNIGKAFTSRYDESTVDEVSLSQYDPSDDKFDGWYTNSVGGSKVTNYSPVSDETFYAHYLDTNQVIITIDGEAEIHNVGETFNLPESKTKTGSSITITFDHNNGTDETTVKSIDTVYTFSGYRLESNNSLYQVNDSFTLSENMSFTSEYTDSTVYPEWPSDPVKQDYIFMGWYTTRTGGAEVFNYDDVTMNTTYYAHYTTDPDSFITLTNTITGETEKILTNSDYVFAEGKFNKVDEELIGKVTYKFNADGYPDEIVDYKKLHTPTGFYVNGDTDNLYDINETYQFSSDTSITPYYDSANDVFDTSISLDRFDYEVTKEDHAPACFSKDDQTDVTDVSPYTCYENYDPADGNVTVYLHWSPQKPINVTMPDGTIEVHNIYESLDLGTNDIVNPNEIVYNLTFKYHDDVTADATTSYSTTYVPNGWIVSTENTNTYYDDGDILVLTDDCVITPRYTHSSTAITWPSNPTRSDYNFLGWNEQADGLGKFYTSQDFNNITASGEKTLHAVWSQEQTVTITFDSQGGSEVDPITRAYNTAVGTLPNAPKKTGYTFDGWYTDTTYTTEVDENYVVKYDMTVYARWIGSIFPDVWEEEGPTTFTGNNYLNSHIKLYSESNWQKDYEIGLTINSYNSSGSDTQAAFVNAKYENESLKWPGLVFRKNGTNIIEFTQSINGGQKKATTYNITTDITYPLVVRIRRHNGMVRTSIDGGNTWVDLQNMSTFNQNQRHEVETWFGAAADASGNPFRYVKAEMANMYVKLGQIPDDDEVTVTYPDGTTVIKKIGSTLDLSEIDPITKPNLKIATITFKYQDGTTPDAYRYVYTTYTNNGWNVEGSNSGANNYASDAVITLSENIIILPDYVESTTSDEFPSDPTRTNYTFDGWFDSNDTSYTSYANSDDITLYAKWTEDISIPIPGGDPIVVPPGTPITLPNNNVAKASDNLSTVTFKPENNTSDIVRYVTRTYTPNGWLINGVHYDNGDEITVNEYFEPVPDYTSDVVGVEFPDDPTYTGKDFTGWFDSQTDGTKYTEYADPDNDITLYAQWVKHKPQIITPVGPVYPDDDGNYTFEENNIDKDEELLATVTFIYHNGHSDTYGYVVKRFIKNGWTYNGNHYNAGDVIAVTEDIEIEPAYTDEIVPASFPADPTAPNDTFLGWFTSKDGGTQYTEYNETQDISLHAHWENGTDIDPIDPVENSYTISIDGNVVETVEGGTSYVIPENTKAKASETYIITFKPQNGEDDSASTGTISYIPSGYIREGEHINTGVSIIVNSNIELTSDYVAVKVDPSFPETPTNGDKEFKGWFTAATSGEKVDTLDNIKVDTTLYAHWSTDLPSEIGLDVDNITIVKGQTYPIVVNTVPNDVNCDFLYTGYDDIISIDNTGVITANEAGTTEVTITVDGDDSVTTTLTVNVIDNRITSQTLTIVDKDLTGETIRIIHGSEPETSITDYLTNIDNDLNYIKVYNKNDDLVDPNDYDDTLITTGSVLKLVIDDVEYDSVLVIVKGDLNKDGKVNITDSSIVANHILRKELIDDYAIYAGDIVENEGSTIDNAINIADNSQIDEFILRKRDSLNNKEGGE